MAGVLVKGSSRSDVRDHFVDNLEKRLLGPENGPNEIVGVFPNRKYIVGVLYPSNTELMEDEADGTEFDEETPDEEGFGPVVRGSVDDDILPSSIGISFRTDVKVKELAVDVTWATYAQVKDRRSGKDTRDFQRSERSRTIMMQVPDEMTEIDVPLYDDLEEEKLSFYLRLKTYPKKVASRDLTIFLVNMETLRNKKGTSEQKRERATKCIYSPRIHVGSPKNIVAREEGLVNKGDEDLESMALLYHDRFEYATGHGCSVEWSGESEGRCDEVSTTFLPRYTMPPLFFDIEGIDLLMGQMALADNKEKVLNVLEGLLYRYGSWLDQTFSDASKKSLPSNLSKVFDRHRDDGRKSLDRMRAGLEIIKKDLTAYEAFRFMNEALFLQWVHKDLAKKGKEEPDKPYLPPKYDMARDTYRWRPFQIAFILQNIPGIVDPHSDERQIVDLLWIPTGGGKTEAYLGLSAFIMAFRRLTSKGLYDQHGVSILMRYTLRLLTIQQFQRAVSLMCACESIRTKDKASIKTWGDVPFSVGLYVGQDSTPNKVVHRGEYCKSCAQEAVLDYQRTREKPKKSNPFQLMMCPWCGRPLDHNSYKVDDRLIRLQVRCTRPGCEFSKRDIPALTVDEEIYHRLPTMLIATVDKFAQLPFDPKLGMLFGHVHHYVQDVGFYCRADKKYAQRDAKNAQRQIYDMGPTRLKPMDLIIQDELHLITGPLGSMVGMYETSIEKLNERDTVKGRYYPKVIASTATIRRAPYQIKNLFVRPVKKFPSPGTDYSDSFFVKEDPSRISDGKLYIGLFPSGIGQKTAMKKTLASLLRDGQYAKSSGADPRSWDDYWTLVSYYNSIRELGSAKTTIDDDVSNEVRGLRQIKYPSELTSKVPTRLLPTILSDLELRGTDPGAIDVLTCSNMFSVGVDVQRLGLMVMNNQPKSSSEYIQSTGRVGRSGCGLVVMLYNWSRPRDQSHFERFFDYHNRIQLHVEAVTVTPFSQGVRERAMHAQFITMLRDLDRGDYYKDEDAGDFTAAVRCGTESQDYIRTIKDRYEVVNGGKVDRLIELERDLDDWVKYAGKGIRYQKDWRSRGVRDNVVLMLKPDDDPLYCSGPQILTPSSMRTVERSIPVREISGLPM